MARGDIKHTVTINGRTFTRKSPRPYAFAIIGRRDIDRSSRGVLSDAARESITRDFNWHVKVADGREQTFSDKSREDAKRYAAMGLDGYIADREARTRQQFAEAVAAGHYRLNVVSWSMSRVNAEKTAATYRNGYGFKDVEVVPVGSNITRPEPEIKL